MKKLFNYAILIAILIAIVEGFIYYPVATAITLVVSIIVLFVGGSILAAYGLRHKFRYDQLWVTAPIADAFYYHGFDCDRRSVETTSVHLELSHNEHRASIHFDNPFFFGSMKFEVHINDRCFKIKHEDVDSFIHVLPKLIEDITGATLITEDDEQRRKRWLRAIS